MFSIGGADQRLRRAKLGLGPRSIETRKTKLAATHRAKAKFCTGLLKRFAISSKFLNGACFRLQQAQLVGNVAEALHKQSASMLRFLQAWLS